MARDNLAENAFSALFSMDPNIRSPYVQQWTFGIQHALDESTVFEVRYVGNKGTKLWRGFDLNQVLIRENGFLDDFQRARSNGFLALDSNGSFDPSFNPSLPGSQQLTVFPELFLGGLLSNTAVRSLIQRGETGELAATYYGLGFSQGTNVALVPNQNTFVSDLITNFSNSSYNALQVELRRRAAAGVQFQANYTFAKVLTDSSGTLVRFDPFLDINNPKIGRARGRLRHQSRIQCQLRLAVTARPRPTVGLRAVASSDGRVDDLVDCLVAVRRSAVDLIRTGHSEPPNSLGREHGGHGVEQGPTR